VGRASNRKKAQRQAGPSSRQAGAGPAEPVTSADLGRLLQLAGNSPRSLEQQMLARLKQETRVGGKRVVRQELPELP
jgi:hypothetical protein